MVGIVAAVGGEIEGDREPLLPGREVAAVEGVRILRRWRSRHIAGSSRAGSRTWWGRGRAGTARCPDRSRRGPALPILRAVGRLHRNPFRGHPRLGGGRRRGGAGACGRREGDFREIRDAGHRPAALVAGVPWSGLIGAGPAAANGRKVGPSRNGRRGATGPRSAPSPQTSGTDTRGGHATSASRVRVMRLTSGAPAASPRLRARRSKRAATAQRSSARASARSAASQPCCAR